MHDHLASSCGTLMSNGQPPTRSIYLPQIMGRMPAELTRSSYHLLASSLPRLAARLCLMLERESVLPLKVNTIAKMTDDRFLAYAGISEVGPR